MSVGAPSLSPHPTWHRLLRVGIAMQLPAPDSGRGSGFRLSGIAAVDPRSRFRFGEAAGGRGRRGAGKWIRPCISWPAARPPLSGMAFEMLLRRIGSPYTAHGFRSSFRDWAGNETHFPRELAEHALAHVIGDKAEQAYRRSDALARRRELMDAWARHCEGGASGNVLTFKRLA
jgi:hypothetical protein